MTNASSSSRRTKPASSAQGTSVVPEIEVDPASHSGLSDVTVNVAAMPQALGAMPAIPELDEPATENAARPNGRGRTYNQPYVNPLMPVLRRLRRQDPADIPEAEMDALMAFMGDETGEVRVNSIFLSDTLSFITGEMFERYSRTSLTLAIYLGKTGGMGVSAAKREIARATGVTLGESDPLNGFPRHSGLKYTAQQLVDAVAYLNEAYGEHGSIVPGAITASNEELRAKNEAAGRPNRY